MRSTTKLLSLSLYCSLASACVAETPGDDPRAGASTTGGKSDVGGGGTFDGTGQGWSDILAVAPGTELYASVDGCGPLAAELATLDERRAAIRLKWGPNASDWYLRGFVSLEDQLWLLEVADGNGLVEGARVDLTATLTGEGETVTLAMPGTVRPRASADVVEIAFPGTTMIIHRIDDAEFTVDFSAAAAAIAGLETPAPQGLDLYNMCGNQADGSARKLFRYFVP